MLKTKSSPLSSMLALTFFSTVAAGGTPEKPNFVLILADDVGTGDLAAFYEESQVESPNLGKLVEEGMVFGQAYAPGAVCSPSRYSLLTGEYPFRGPLRERNSPWNGPLTIDTDSMSLPRFLGEHGYQSAQIGKWHLGYGNPVIENWAGPIKPGPLEIGFDFHFGVPANHSDQFKSYIRNHELMWVKEGIASLEGRPEIEDLEKIRYDDEVDSDLTAQAIQFIEENKDQPFFLYLALVATHTHVTPRVDFRNVSPIGQLGDYLMELDHHVGSIIQTLEDHELRENTVFIFTSDNGGQRDDFPTAGKNLNLRDTSGDVALKARTAKTDAHEKFGHQTNGKLRGYKGSNWEGGFRVPMVISWPGKIDSGSRSEAMICLTDFFATFAGILEQELPEKTARDSMDQSPILLGKIKNSTIRTSVVLQTGRNDLAYRENHWKIRSTTPTDWGGENDPISLETLELYNLEKDPTESTDLAEEFSDKKKALHANLLEILLN